MDPEMALTCAYLVWRLRRALGTSGARQCVWALADEARVRGLEVKKREKGCETGELLGESVGESVDCLGDLRI